MAVVLATGLPVFADDGIVCTLAIPDSGFASVNKTIDLPTDSTRLINLTATPAPTTPPVVTKPAPEKGKTDDTIVLPKTDSGKLKPLPPDLLGLKPLTDFRYLDLDKKIIVLPSSDEPIKGYEISYTDVTEGQDFGTILPSTVPEPTTLTAFLAGLAALVLRRRKYHR